MESCNALMIRMMVTGTADHENECIYVCAQCSQSADRAESVFIRHIIEKLVSVTAYFHTLHRNIGLVTC